MSTPSWLRLITLEQVMRGDGSKYSIKAAHAEYHKMGYGSEEPINNENRTLDCDICCGIPPWKWCSSEGDCWCGMSCYNVTDFFPCRRGKRYFFKVEDCPNARDIPKKGYVITYRAFGWKKPRVWKVLGRPYGPCSKCSAIGPVARHRATNPDGTHRSGWEGLHVCLKCVRSENQAAKKLNQAKEIKRLLRELRKMAKGA